MTLKRSQTWAGVFRALLLVAGGLGLGASAICAEPTYGLVAELCLAPSADGNDGWVVTNFEAQVSTSGFLPMNFESRPVLSRIGRIVNPPNLVLPVPLDRLVAAIQTLDPEREWLPLADFAPRTGYQSVLLPYRNRARDFTVDIHVQGEDSTANPVSLSLETQPTVVARYRGPAGFPPTVLADAVGQAARRALEIARSEHLAPGGQPGSKDGIRVGLRNEFLLDGVPGTAPAYGVEELDGRASGLVVQPVFVPRAIAIELDGWTAFEAEFPGLIATQLKAKRLSREKEIRAELGRVLPEGPALVTSATVAGWQATELGKKFELRPLRYERDTLVLSAAEFASKQVYTVKPGVSYGATDGFQVNGSVHVLHERNTQLDAGLDGSYGSDAESLDATARWSPKLPVAGWRLNVDASAGTRRNAAARFGPASGGEPVNWRRWEASLGLTARREAQEPAAGEWRSGFSAGLQLIRSDDAFAATAPLPADAARPDSRCELKSEWRTATRLRDSNNRVGLGTRLRLAQAFASVGGNYDYRLAEIQLSGEFVTGVTDGHAWKAGTTLRAGRLAGTSPFSRQFRAGGDAGWIRGLQEGELAGRAYGAGSLAVGPEVSSLLGTKTPDRPPVFLLAFHDRGRVQDTARVWRSARGYGLALELTDLPVGKVSASLLFGYAYSPDSVADRHGAVFVRIDLPFVN